MKVYFGGWYQRTTLHLSEVYDLFAKAKSELPLSQSKLTELKENLDILDISRESGYLESVKAVTRSGITIKYYEDGLYILEIEKNNVLDAREFLEEYYNERMLPALSYIFSLGAPTPKILANIKTVHPSVVVDKSTDFSKYNIDEKVYGEVYSRVESGNFCVYKTPEYIFVVSKHKDEDIAGSLVELQIFFREFKDQLQKYLNIHRIIWQDISKLKDQKQIVGKDVRDTRIKLDQYQNTISLISNRINQMSSYAKTRQTIAKEFKLEDSLLKLYQYKFDALNDSLSYIKEIWKMTTDYVANSIKVLAEIEEISLNNTLKSLQIITSVGVLSTVLGYLTKETFPHPTTNGLIFFGILIAAAVLLNVVIAAIYRNIKYKMKFVERVSNI